MTSRQQRSILVALFLMLSLFLVACERPMPGDSEVLPTITSVETDSTSQSETDPVPPADTAEDSSAAEENEAAEADLIQPAEGEVLEDESPEGEVAEGDIAGGDVTESDAVEGDAAEEEGVEQTEEVDNETADSSEETPAVETGRTHTVAAGENLFRISMQYGISWVTLAQVNGLTNADSISVGQVLIIPDEEITETSETAESSETPVTEEPSEDSEGSEEQESVESDSVETDSEETTYVVQSGDNLFRISSQFGLSMMEIARANGLADFNQVFEGQELIIPQKEEIEDIDADSTDEEATHLVQEGETVFGIAFKYGISWTKLVDANEIPSPYNLEVGQSLIIPSVE